MTMPRFNACLALLLALFYIAWWVVAGANDPLHVALLLLAVAPLVALAPALWRARRFGTALTGFIAPFHFAYALMELVANPTVRGWVIVPSLLALLLFVGSMTVLRQVQR